MWKMKLSQHEIDSLVVVGRMVAKPTVSGVGFNDVNFRVKVDRDDTWQYSVWSSMLKRCYSPKYLAKFPAYAGTTCCQEWLSFANFFEWVNNEADYKGKPVGMQLDKDIKGGGAKHYSPQNCGFVPQAINSLLTANDCNRGDLPVGVTRHGASGVYRSVLNIDCTQVHLGLFQTPEEAFLAYKVAKEQNIKVVAERFKGSISPEMYDALLKWVVKPFGNKNPLDFCDAT